MVIKNMAASVHDRLLNLAKKEKKSYQIVLQLFAQEEFLRKISMSEYVDKFILKGGMFLYTLTDFKSRPTRDIDFMITRTSSNISNIIMIMEEICKINTGNEFIKIASVSYETITIDKKYPGTRCNFMAYIENTRIPFSIDIGVDDVIIPNAVRRVLPTLLSDFSSPYIYTYSLESTIAEKFDAIMKRMEGTGRMKDFEDIFFLSSSYDFSGRTLCKALNATLNKRERENVPNLFQRIEDFDKDKRFVSRWNSYSSLQGNNLELTCVLKRILLFMKPVYYSAINNEEFSANWDCRKAQWLFEKT